jgi:hypothetical protein
LEQAKALAMPNLTPQESLLLQLAEEHLKNLLPPRLMKSMDAFFSQAKRNLGSESTARLEREWPGKVRVVATSQPLLPPKIVPGVFEAVSEALYANRWLTLDYQNSAGKRRSITVMPLAWLSKARVFTWCAVLTALTTSAAWPCIAFARPRHPRSLSSALLNLTCRNTTTMDGLGLAKGIGCNCVFALPRMPAST